MAQAAALTIFGNDVLRGYPRDDFWPASTVFRFCKDVRFQTLHGDPDAPGERLFAVSPTQWMSRLADAGTVGLLIHHVAGDDPQISDRLSVGLVGGGRRWLIETRQRHQSDIWEARWDVGTRDDPDRKIWNVAYYRVGSSVAHMPLQVRSLPLLQRDLRITLSGIEAFASRNQLTGFAKNFRDAIDILASEEPLSGVHHSDLAPTAGTSLEAKQLLGAVQAAWVFGGMGSWNDLGFKGQDQHDYEQLSDELFSLLNQATCSAVNSSSPDAGAVSR
jgi:hypothetical protein